MRAFRLSIGKEWVMTVYMRNLSEYAMENDSLNAHWNAVTVVGDDLNFTPQTIYYGVACLSEADACGIVFG